ncbi:orotidine-5'-phosphate decarboxylase [Ferrimicrobium sp.]|uniref:orotidine-5'-phosphate decarboxylase n=1 Tax=Ferrimicrobium sp. TaxID=2926050 RepID=UPI0026238559|nr:orotidine-5'-phosphate decarboxylase [Ferrimicrobium sp.]
MREHFVLALDRDDSVAALRLASSLREYFAIVKVGLELFVAAGPSVVFSLREAGFRVFIDLKLHDIPTTVYRSARVLGALGPAFVTMHAAGGVEMLRLGVQGLMEGAAEVGEDMPIALAVTVLTSEPAAEEGLLETRISTALAAGVQGYVAGAPDLSVTKMVAPRMISMVPGIRATGAPTDDQARSATVKEALAAGADYLVIGRMLTEAADPIAVADALLSDV